MICNSRTAVGDELPQVSARMSLARFDRIWGSGRPGGPFPQANLHVDQAAAAREGLRAPIAGAPDVMNLICRSLVTFFGAAWLERGGVSLKVRRPVYADEFVTAKGVVTMSEPADGERHRVECEVWVENAEGEKKVTGKATLTAALNKGGLRAP
jgi:acyl dehydratase